MHRTRPDRQRATGERRAPRAAVRAVTAQGDAYAKLPLGRARPAGAGWAAQASSAGRKDNNSADFHHAPTLEHPPAPATTRAHFLLPNPARRQVKWPIGRTCFGRHAHNPRDRSYHFLSLHAREPTRASDNNNNDIKWKGRAEILGAR